MRDALVAAASDLRVGAGGDKGTDVCPMVSAAARDKVAEAIESDRTAADAGGAELLLDGRGDASPAGTLLGPTIAAVDDPESELARDELFGPLLTVVEVDDLDPALDFVNGSRYGNAGAIFTQSGEAARRYRYEAQAGMLGVNVGVPAPVAWFPFSGLEGLDRRRSARQRHGRGGLLHSEEGCDEPLVREGGSRLAECLNPPSAD